MEACICALSPSKASTSPVPGCPGPPSVQAADKGPGRSLARLVHAPTTRAAGQLHKACQELAPSILPEGSRQCPSLSLGWGGGEVGCFTGRIQCPPTPHTQGECCRSSEGAPPLSLGCDASALPRGGGGVKGP